MERVLAMKKTLALLLGMLLLCTRCAREAAPSAIEAEATTTAATTAAPPATTAPPVIITAPPPDPNRVKAIMEPVQGGEMLYTFEGRNGKLGLINQDGEVVAEPEYDYDFYQRYFTDDTGRIIGLLARKDRKHFIYSLDGSYQIFTYSCDGFDIQNGGRYATVTSVVGEFEEGLYDLWEGKYIIPPNSGIQITWAEGNIAFLSGQRIFNGNDGSLLEFPGEGRLTWYNPSVGWIGTTDGGGGYMARYYDWDFNEVLSPWRADGRFINGDYSMAAQHDPSKEITRYAFVSRKGKIVREDMYVDIKQYGNFFQAEEKDGTVLWLDENLNELGRPKKGEELLGVFINSDRSDYAFLHLDANGNVLRTLDSNFEMVEANGIYANVGPFSSWIYYRRKNGAWTKLDISHYAKTNQQAYARVVCDEYLVICIEDLGSDKWAEPYIPPSIVEVFSVNWNGERIQSPFTPYYSGAEFESVFDVFHTADFQGPNYYWVEHGGKRGYIDVKGNWLFIDKTGK